MKKILAVLIAALMICLSVVPAMAVFPVGDALYFVGQCIELYNTSAQIHEAYADTIQKAMDYRKYYNEQGLAKAYDKMQVSMRNLGTSTYNTVLNTTNKTFYDIRNNFKFTYNTAYYNQTYNSYYIPVTYNDVDYNYFITYAPTYTNITYIQDGCNDPAQAVSDNYYFELPDGRNSYNLTADDVFGIPLAGEVINYDAVPENDNCVALYHFDGNIKDSSGAGSVASFLEGSIPVYRESDSYGQCLYLSSTDNLSITLPQELEAPYTIEFRVNYGTSRTFTPASSFFAIRSFASSGKYTNEFTRSISIPDPRNELAEYLYLYEEGVESWFALVPFLSFLGVDGSDSVERISIYCNTSSISVYRYSSVYYVYHQGLGTYIPMTEYELYNASAYATAVAAADKARANNSFKPSSVNFSSFPLNRETWYNISIVNDGTQIKWYREGVPFTPPDGWNVSNGSISSVSLSGVAGLTYSCYDELRISKGALYSGEYTPHVGPFDVPTVLVTPDISAVPDGTVAVKSAVSVADFRVGGVRPSYPVEGSVYISLDADKKVTSCQQYQSGTWTECQGSVCDNDTWVDLSGYSFAGLVVNEDDFAEVVDKKEDPSAGTDANPEAEATSFTVHYYKEGTTDKVRRDTVYENLAVGAAFTASAPTVKGYKALVASADITVTADGEYIFYYSVDKSTDPGGSGGDDDPSKPGFFDGLLSGVKSLVNVICSFVGGVVQAVLSGITGIISTLIEAFKAVLSLGGHFGDFLAAALGFVPREIIDLLIAGIAVSIALAIVKFIRG